MFLHVRVATYVDDHKLDILFNDGKRGVADLSASLRGPMFEPLKDQAVFAQLVVDHELQTVVWPNGGRYRARVPLFPGISGRTRTSGSIPRMGIPGRCAGVSPGRGPR
jgi:hypothetical protein